MFQLVILQMYLWYLFPFFVNQSIDLKHPFFSYIFPICYALICLSRSPSVEKMSEVEEYRCFVGSLSWSTTDGSLKEAFQKFGHLTEAKVGICFYYSISLILCYLLSSFNSNILHIILSYYH